MRGVLLAILVTLVACESEEMFVERPDFTACVDAVVPLDSVPDRYVHPEFALMTPQAIGDSLQAMDHTVVVDARNRLHCFWTRGWGWDDGITFGHASSVDLVGWELHESIELASDEYPIDRRWAPQVFWFEGEWHMYFTGVEIADPYRDSVQRIFHSTSQDLFTWSTADMVLEPRHERTAWASDIPFADDARDQIVFRSGERWLMLLTVRLPDREQSLALAERIGGDWMVIDVLESIRGEVIESPFIYTVDGAPRILINNWRDGGQALWTAASLDGLWTRDPADLRGFAWELLGLDSGYVMASRVWGSSVLLTSIDLEDLGATNMIYPGCYTGEAPLLPALTPVWEVTVD